MPNAGSLLRHGLRKICITALKEGYFRLVKPLLIVGGALTGQALTKKKLIPVIDGLLAASAIHHNLTFVTRNTKDVEDTGVNLFNPWQDT